MKVLKISGASTQELASRRANTRVLWGLRHSLPTTEELLVSGGDARIELRHHRLNNTLTNQYGCTATPDSALVALGSSTASVISVGGYAAAELLRSRLLLAVQMEPPAQVYAGEQARQRSELAMLCGVADMPRLNIVFGASGTDLHRIAAQRCAGRTQAPVLTITVDASETGSGVPSALAVAGTNKPVYVALRLPDGSLRASADIDAVILALTGAAVAAGKRVLLVAVDVSKTGLMAPSAACIAGLKQRYADSLDVLIDACQFRIAPSTLRAYLDLGCMVALTGSKFVTGPAFSGALLLPAPVAMRRHAPRADSPTGWGGKCEASCEAGRETELNDAANFGLVLRWEAALHELREFRAVPDAHVVAFLARYAAAVRERLESDGLFEALPVSPFDRDALGAARTWDAIQTIFPFVLHHPASRGGLTLGAAETERLYRTLHQGAGTPALRCQFGQPVACGHRNGSPFSALRLCASARLVVEATSGNNATGVINRTLAALDKTAELLRNGAYAHL